MYEKLGPPCDDDWGWRNLEETGSVNRPGGLYVWGKNEIALMGPG